MTKEMAVIAALENKVKAQSYGELPGCSSAIAMAEIAKSQDVTVIVCPTDKQAEMLADEIRFFAPLDVVVVWEPDTGTLPYDTEETPLERQSKIASSRYALLSRSDKVCFVTSVANILRLGPSREFILSSTKIISLGDSLDIDEFWLFLKNIGYNDECIEVEEPGEIVRHNNIIDIYPVGEAQPCRIRINDNGTIDSLMEIDVATQRSDKDKSTLAVMSARAYPWGDEEREQLVSNYRLRCEKLLDDSFYQEVRAGKEPSGVELYLPWFAGELESIIDWLPENSPLIFYSSAKEDLDNHHDFIVNRFEDLSSGGTILVDPNERWLHPSGLIERANHCCILEIDEKSRDVNCGIVEIDFSRQRSLDATVDMLDPWVSSAKKTLICVNSETRVAQANLISTVLGYEPKRVGSWDEFLTSQEKICIAKNAVDHGCFIPDKSILVVHERGIFGQPLLEGEDDTASHDFDSIKDLKNLRPGDPVVHERHGVGRFIDMQPVEIDGIARDYMRISYDEGATAFVSMDELNLVDRYGGIASENTPLHLMGSDEWKKALSEAKEDALSTAKGLVSIKRLREKSKGISFNKPNYLYNEFCSYFPYRETRDQLKAVQDVVADMMAASPMDRVICGDVGFGKTEVAMRASCLGVISGYQVAVLVPTTLLSEQHYHAFSERFEMIGKTVVQLSSNATAKEEKKALSMISSGEADIIIGTQRLLMEDVSWESIGLLVIDEEHRFGVGEKEYLKSLRGHLDTLSMTATPIPRTMTMGLQGVRGFSVISTPPAKRLSVRTLLTQSDPTVIKEGIQRELARGGQIFFLHNNTKSIKSKAEEIESLIPGLKVTYAHGKLSDKEMTRRVQAFKDKSYDVLVATTIIEIGIDVPNANTIFIDNAQNMGLAQLHQLRGRVGRSSRQAYCYLLTSGITSELARSRLEAITKASRLGEGFILAYHDMEIRGAGELLGEKQSGNIQAVSFNLYMRILGKAVSAMEEGKPVSSIFASDESTYLDLHSTGLIPESYIESSSLRLSYYKKLSKIEDEEVLDEIAQEMQSRFGQLPQEVRDLLIILKVRCAMQFVGIHKLNLGENGGELTLREHGAVLPRRLVNIVENIEGAEISGPRSVRIKAFTRDLEDRAKFAMKMIQWLIK